MLDKIAEIAVEAGAVILEIYNADGLQADVKGDGSPVTAADHAAEAVILRKLKLLAPEIPVIAEEESAAGRVPATENQFFLVDPLDGTKEFINRNGEFTVNIALVKNGKPVLGVVYAPALGVLYTGETGAGAQRGNVSGRTIMNQRPIYAGAGARDGLRAVASRSHMGLETEDYLKRLRIMNLVSAGSSLKFCKVAEGEADIYPRLGRTMEWDTAAGDAVLRAAGGTVSTLNGAALTYGKCQQVDDSDYANPWFVAIGALELALYQRP